MNAIAPHVVMVTNAVAPDKLGGLERYVRELSRGLVAVGGSVTVVTKRTAAEQPDHERGEDGVRVRRYSPPAKSDPLFAARYPFDISRGVRAQVSLAVRDGAGRRVVLHGHFPVPMLGPALRRTSFVYTCHAPVYRELLSERRGSYALPRPLHNAAVQGLRAAERHVLRRAHALVTLSEFVRAEVATLDRAAGERVALIPGGLDTTWFSPAATPAAVSHAPADTEITLFTARRLVERTGVDRLVEAMPAILARIPGARLEIAGSGPLGAAIADRVRELGLSERVRLLGRISEEDLRDAYRRADLAITPTVALEGFGLATAEALACGTVVVVTPIGANPEVVRDLSPHFIARSASPRDIAEAVVDALNLPDIDGLRSRARSHVHPRWAWPSVVDAHLELYDRQPSL
ncbi:glycosyltransferase [Microbacterium testaceum StLB037]|uniref:D-inositol 3-phosphate glycosyltransferase n=1 Tax=Microbacterium testaceum (strain StLB037) TaxID=979556 RepID=E8NES4_MICTS|nr:glycosyltransferase family 4 protein [Microbacterium testaceum]BAJ75159.1 glycosyltransferase [Microbacterium testaceum StLB037]